MRTKCVSVARLNALTLIWEIPNNTEIVCFILLKEFTYVMEHINMFHSLLYHVLKENVSCC